MKADDAAAQKTGQELAMPWADAEALGTGPRDVPEGDDHRLGQTLSDQRGGEREVIVLHQHDRIFGLGLGADRIGKALVHVAILLEVMTTKLGPGMRQMAERPQSLVGKAVVVAALFVFAQPDPAQPVAVLFLTAGRYAQPAFSVGGLAISAATAMCDPDARAGAHHRLDRGHQAAGGMQNCDLTAGIASVDIGFTIGQQQHLLALHIAP